MHHTVHEMIMSLCNAADWKEVKQQVQQLTKSAAKVVMIFEGAISALHQELLLLFVSYLAHSTVVGACAYLACSFFFKSWHSSTSSLLPALS